MKDLFLILILLATFAFGYYVVVRFGDFIEENQRLIAEGNRNSQCKIHIAAETPMLLNSIASALESYSESAPHVEFFLSSGQINHLLDKLINERINGIPFVPQKLRNFPAILEHRKIQTNPL